MEQMKRRTAKVWRALATTGIVIVGMSSLQPAFADTLLPPPPPPVSGQPPVLPPPSETSPIDTKYGDLQGVRGRLGNTVGSLVTGLVNGGSMQQYENGSIYYTKATGAHVVEGAIGAKWIAAGAQNSGLGYPTSDEISGLKNGGVYQNYQGGAIVYSPATGPHISNGGIRTVWASYGYENGRLGYPTTDEISGLKDGGVYQNYQGGAVVWSPSTGAFISAGGIRADWAANGYETGKLGYPTSNEIGGLKNGGVYQTYQGGAVVWSPATGAHLSTGAIRTTWGGAGYENGGLGYPTSDEISGLKNGGVYQNYQGGAIVYSPATGAHISVGATRGAWASQGYENGRLGYPTTNEYAYGSGVRQNYQGGYITWTPTGGAQIH